jgi:hypothetical protein
VRIAIGCISISTVLLCGCRHDSSDRNIDGFGCLAATSKKRYSTAINGMQKFLKKNPSDLVLDSVKLRFEQLDRIKR